LSAIAELLSPVGVSALYSLLSTLIVDGVEPSDIMIVARL